MEFRGWTYPYDHNGRRRDYGEMPKRLLSSRTIPIGDWPAWCRLAGGFAKVPAPFAEFLWADFFRPRVDARIIKDCAPSSDTARGQARPLGAGSLPAGMDRQVDLERRGGLRSATCSYNAASPTAR